MTTASTVETQLDFRVGDAVVVLYEGLYNGIPGHFLGLREDSNWADIEERSGLIRSHPVRWLRPAEDFPDLAVSHDASRMLAAES